MEEAREAAALQLGEVQGQWKARLSEAEVTHAENVHMLQRQMRQSLQEARRQADDDLAAAQGWESLWHLLLLCECVRTRQHCCKGAVTIARHGLIHMLMSTDNDWSYSESTMREPKLSCGTAGFCLTGITILGQFSLG